MSLRHNSHSLPGEEDMLGHPAYIEAAYQDAYPNEVDFYSRVIAEKCGPGVPVLELGCGFGRVAIPMARAGFRMIGLDRHDGMLDALRQRQRGLPNPIEIVRMDLRDFRLPARVQAAICPLGVLNLLWSRDSMAAHLACLREALAPGGIALYVVNVADDPERLYPHRATWTTRSGQVTCHTDYRFDRDPAHPVEIAHFDHVIEVRDGATRRLLSWRGRMRILTSGFVRELLDKVGGLEILRWYPLFQAGHPLDEPPPDPVCVLAIGRTR